jgi:hypothetical protein
VSVQVVPLNPGAHVQVKLLMPSVQAPPLRHGLQAHSLMLVSQVVPL